MNINEILSQMSTDITTLSFAEKMLGATMVTLLSMAIVFIVLIILIGVITLMDKMLNGKTPKQESAEEIEYIEEYEEEEDSSELIAVISAAVASSLGVSESSIKVVNISRSGDITPAWAQNGRIDQIQSRL